MLAAWRLAEEAREAEGGALAWLASALALADMLGLFVVGFGLRLA